MTVSEVALDPRQWPAQPINERMLADWEHVLQDSQVVWSHTVLGRAVLVGVVATEDDALLVGSDNTVIPANGAGRRAIAKVLHDKVGGVAECKQVVSGMLGKLDSLIEGSLELSTESAVA